AVAVAVALGLPLLSLARIAREPVEPSPAGLRALLRLTRASIPADTRAVILCEPAWWGQALAVNAPEDWPASRYRLVTNRELLLRGYDAATWAVCAPEFFRRPRGRTRGVFELGDWATALTPGTALYVTGELPPEMRKTCFSTMSGILQRLVLKEQASGVALAVPEAISFWKEAAPLLAATSASNSDPVCATLARSLNFALASSRTPDLRLATFGTSLRVANPSLALNLRLLDKATERGAVREVGTLAAALERDVWSGWDISLWHGHFGPVLSAAHFRALSAFWFRRGHLPAARWAVNRALAFDSSDEGAAYLSVELAVQEGRSAEALHEAEAFLAGHPKLPSRPRARLHQLAALTARNLGQFDLAEHHFTQAVEVDHNLPGLDYEIAVLRLLQRRWDDAAVRFSALLASVPGRADALLGLGLAEASRGRKEAARVALNQALTVAPEDSRASLLLAWLDAREGRLAEAESRLFGQIAKSRDPGPARDLLAAVRAAKEELLGTRAKPRAPPPSVSPEPPVIPLEKTAQTVPP
ncbi:MAG: tetratricopeptide repeat protein, partial [Verrucomicrobiia bacterium]